MIKVNKKIRDFRLKKGLSLAKTAEISGLSKSQLSKIECGKQALPVSLLETIARSLDIEITDFFESSDTVIMWSSLLETIDCINVG